SLPRQANHLHRCSATSILRLPLSCSSLIEERTACTSFPRGPPPACSSMDLDHGVAVLISDSLTWCCLARVHKRPKRNSSLCAGKCDHDFGGRYADICGLQHIRRIT